MYVIRLEREQVKTAILMFLKEVRGISFASVADVRWPVYSSDGDPGAIIDVASSPTVGETCEAGGGI